MNDRDSFIAAIIAQPLDVTLRLVFADWLEENGYAEEGRWVRVDVEIGQNPAFLDPFDVNFWTGGWKKLNPGVELLYYARKEVERREHSKRFWSVLLGEEQP